MNPAKPRIRWPKYRFADFGVFANTPKVRAWRHSLAARSSVREAALPEYNARLRASRISTAAGHIPGARPIDFVSQKFIIRDAVGLEAFQKTAGIG